MIRYVGLAVLLCALAGCGNVRERVPEEQQDEVSEGVMPQERKQPMLIRAGPPETGMVLCLHAIEAPVPRYERIFSERPCRFGSRGHQSVSNGAAVREIPVEVFSFGFSPGVIAVKKGERVRLMVTSRDVLHGVLVREYRINVPVRRGEMRTIEFVASAAGEFTIRCPVYCGQGHAQMAARLIVEE